MFSVHRHLLCGPTSLSFFISPHKRLGPGASGRGKVDILSWLQPLIHQGVSLFFLRISMPVNASDTATDNPTRFRPSWTSCNRSMSGARPRSALRRRSLQYLFLTLVLSRALLRRNPARTRCSTKQRIYPLHQSSNAHSSLAFR